MDTLIRVTLTDVNKQIVINSSDIAFVVQEGSGCTVTIRPKIARYPLAESFMTVINSMCRPFVAFIDFESGKLTAIAKSFVHRAEPNSSGTADIFGKDPLVRFISTEAWETISAYMTECVSPVITNKITKRQHFVGITDTITVTNGNLPSNKQMVYVYQNGQLISPDYYNVSGNVITLTYQAFPEDMFTVVYGDVIAYLPSIDGVHRQQFTGISDTIIVTSTMMPSEIFLYQNGQLIDPTYYSVSENVITLTYTALPEDVFTVVFGNIAIYPPVIAGVLREDFTNIINSIVVTVNGGVLPTDKELVYVYQNGQLISPDYYNVAANTITLTYNAELSDTFTIIFDAFET